MNHTYNIVKYEKIYYNEWNTFVEESINGNIYHSRIFLSYHPEDRFEDTSIMIYKDNILVCVLPSCKNGDKYFSHKGATYGGPVFSKDVYNIKYLNILINKIFEYYNYNIEFRICNSIYNSVSDNSLLYLLGSKLKMCPELAWYIHTNENIIENISNIRNKKSLLKIMNNNEYVCDSFSDKEYYIKFYKILKKNLNTKYDTNPTHTLEEFLFLSDILKDKQRLYLVKYKDIIYGGVYVIKVTKNCWYTFYISKNIDISNNLSIIYIMYKIQQDALKENVKYVDYGITTEDAGKKINIGLAEFKESSLTGISSNRYLFLV